MSGETYPQYRRNMERSWAQGQRSADREFLARRMDLVAWENLTQLLAEQFR